MPGPWGRALRELRGRKGWTQKKAAKAGKMTPTSYGRLEKGGHTRTRKLLDLADAFGVPIEEVLVPAAPHQRTGELEAYLARLVREGMDERLHQFDTPTAAAARDEFLIQAVVDRIKQLGRAATRPSTSKKIVDAQKRRK